MNPQTIALIIQIAQAEMTMLPAEIQAIQTIVSAISGNATVQPNATLAANDAQIKSLLAQLKALIPAPVPA